jgi:V/A-type H+/Na+-transporting ATPase subunit I
MALLQMKKVALIAHATSRAAVMKTLQETGAVEITLTGQEELRAASAPETLSALEGRLADVRESLLLIKKYDETKTGFLTPKPAISRGELKSMSERFAEADKAVTRMLKFSEEMNALKSRRQRLSSRIAQLEPFESFDAPLESIGTGRYTTSILGTIPNTATEKFEQICESFADQAYFEMIDQTYLSLYVVMPVDIAEKLTGELKYIGFTEAYTKDLYGTPKDLIYDYRSECEAIEREAGEHEEKAKKFVDDKLTLQAVEDYLVNEIERERSVEKLGETGEAFMLEGWALAENQEKLQNALTQAAPESYITFRDPLDEENPPTAIRNVKLVVPFEAVTDMYSVPNSRGFDPNAIMSVFYFILFGMMIGDAAYGVILSIGAYVVLRLKKPTGMFRKVTKIIMFGGISTMLWGLVFGTVFAIPGIPALINPLGEEGGAMKLLVLCLAVGAVHLTAGQIVGAYILIKQHKFWDAVFDKFTWITFMAGAAMIALGGSVGTAGLYIMLGSLAIVLLTGGRSRKGIFKKFIGGFGALYSGATGNLSDLLSYCRLFGMGLATSVIAMVFNTIGSLFFGSWYGYIAAAIVLVIGHVFNIAINALGAFVHTARLQFIEFYGRFFEGGGHAFAPLTIKAKNYRMEG